MVIEIDEKDLWVGFDLDGTLAMLEPDFVSPTHIGEPIAIMVYELRWWIAQGVTVKIFTARVSKAWYKVVGEKQAAKIRPAIEEWCDKHLGFIPEITCEKDHLMSRLYDDIDLIQVKRNKGIIGS